MSKPVTLKFHGMNNVTDPSDVKSIHDPKFNPFSECVDLVNVDADNNGGVALRSHRTAAMPTVDTVTFEGMTFTAGSQDISIGSMPTTESVYRYGQFDASFSGGDIVEYYNGRLYRAGRLDGIATVVCSKPIEYGTVDLRTHVAHVSGNDITMVGAVDDGLYVGTTTEVLFLQGDPEQGGFILRQVLPYGVIKGTRVRTNGLKCPVSQMTGSIIVFASYRGVCVAGNGGTVLNISQGRVEYDYGISGSAILREEHGLVHYLFQPSVGVETDNIYVPPTIDMDNIYT